MPDYIRFDAASQRYAYKATVGNDAPESCDACAGEWWLIGVTAWTCTNCGYRQEGNSLATTDFFSEKEMVSPRQMQSLDCCTYGGFRT